MKRLLVWLVLAAVNGGWEVSFASHPANVAVLFITSCEGTPPIVAFQRQDIDEQPFEGAVWQVWPRLESGRRCTTEVSLLRNDANSIDPGDEYVAESAVGSFVY